MVVNTKGTSMNMKTGKKMKGGFMCMSRSMALPPIQRSNYIRLGDQRRRRSFPLPSDQHKLPPSIQPTIPPHNLFQVVVMRVSIHCQGCASKVKKHLSKMEGVTSFSIDLESKRVTVMGHVSPSGVLESISKIKKAEFWPC